MKRKGALTLLGAVVVVAAVAAVAVVAYNIGLTNAGNGNHIVFGPMMRGYRGGGLYLGAGGWWWGIIPVLLFGFVMVVLFAALFGGQGRSAPTTSSTPSGDGPAGLRELVEMHDRGALTDEEFAAAKRKMLGL